MVRLSEPTTTRVLNAHTGGQFEAGEAHDRYSTLTGGVQPTGVREQPEPRRSTGLEQVRPRAH